MAIASEEIESVINSIAAEAQVDPEVSYVYFLMNEDGKSFKIGKSDKPFSRIKQLPERINLEKSCCFSVEKSSVFRHERILQAIFGDYKIDKEFGDGYTEWFDIIKFDRAIRYVNENVDIIKWTHFETLLEHFKRRTGTNIIVKDGSFAFPDGLKFELTSKCQIPDYEKIKRRLLLNFTKEVWKVALDFRPFSNEVTDMFDGDKYECVLNLDITIKNEYTSIYDDIYELTKSNHTEKIHDNDMSFYGNQLTTNELQEIADSFINALCIEFDSEIGVDRDLAKWLELNIKTFSDLKVFMPKSDEVIAHVQSGLNIDANKVKQFDIVSSAAHVLSKEWCPRRNPSTLLEKLEIVKDMLKASRLLLPESVTSNFPASISAGVLPIVT